MKKQLAIKIFLWAAVIAVMVGIFRFSAENSAESDATSGNFVRAVFGIFPFYRALSESAKTELVESVMFAARKLAHFSIYALLGFWTHLLVRQYILRRALAITVGICALYAATDELHQLFVPGRTGQLRDVFIDSGGALAGALAAWALVLICQKLKKTKGKRA